MEQLIWRLELKGHSIKIHWLNTSSTFLFSALLILLSQCKYQARQETSYTSRSGFPQYTLLSTALMGHSSPTCKEFCFIQDRS